MLYYSTNNREHKVPFFSALMRGLAPDGGLYMPEHFPVSMEIDGDDFPRRTCQLLWHFAPRNGLNRLCYDAFNFDVPLSQLSENLFVLELFHGPTLSFKDFGARFMARSIVQGGCLADGEKLNIVVATSGDTGSAVANGFYGVPGVNVFVLYPKGRVTELQEKQMATLGGNIFALRVVGDFDDCQKMAKDVLGDAVLQKELRLSSANSINPARLLPQMSYYLEAKEKLRWKYGRDERPIFVVPSGNFGNLTAGLFAHRMGARAEFFVAAVNVNSAIPGYLATGTLAAGKTVPTLSNAMDVGKPSNWARIVDLFDGNSNQINIAIKAITATDKETEAAMFYAYDRFGYVADPHTAVGLHAAAEIAKRGFSRTPIVVLSTAHPAKFKESVERVIRVPVEIPERLAAVGKMATLSIEIEPKKEVLARVIKDAN